MLIFQALGVNSQALEAMLTTIQEMKFFLGTAYGQASGAAGTGWAAVRICIIWAHKRKGHGASFLCPISELKSNIAGVIYVDDTDIIHFRMDKTEAVTDAHFHLQSSITNWGK